MIQPTRPNLLSDLSSRAGVDNPIYSEGASVLSAERVVGRTILESGVKTYKDLNHYQQNLAINQMIPINGFHPVTLVTKGRQMIEQSMATVRKDLTPMQLKKRPRYTIDPELEQQGDEMFREIIRPRQTLLDSEQLALQQLHQTNGINPNRLFQMPMQDRYFDIAWQSMKANEQSAKLVVHKRPIEVRQTKYGIYDGDSTLNSTLLNVDEQDTLPLSALYMQRHINEEGNVAAMRDIMRHMEEDDDSWDYSSVALNVSLNRPDDQGVLNRYLKPGDRSAGADSIIASSAQQDDSIMNAKRYRNALRRGYNQEDALLYKRRRSEDDIGGQILRAGIYAGGALMLGNMFIGGGANANPTFALPQLQYQGGGNLAIGHVDNNIVGDQMQWLAQNKLSDSLIKLGEGGVGEISLGNAANKEIQSQLQNEHSRLESQAEAQASRILDQLEESAIENKSQSFDQSGKSFMDGSADALFGNARNQEEVKAEDPVQVSIVNDPERVEAKPEEFKYPPDEDPNGSFMQAKEDAGIGIFDRLYRSPDNIIASIVQKHVRLQEVKLQHYRETGQPVPESEMAKLMKLQETEKRYEQEFVRETIGEVILRYLGQAKDGIDSIAKETAESMIDEALKNNNLKNLPQSLGELGSLIGSAANAGLQSVYDIPKGLADKAIIALGQHVDEVMKEIGIADDPYLAPVYEIAKKGAKRGFSLYQVGTDKWWKGAIIGAAYRNPFATMMFLWVSGKLLSTITSLSARAMKFAASKAGTYSQGIIKNARPALHEARRFMDTILGSVKESAKVKPKELYDYFGQVLPINFIYDSTLAIGKQESQKILERLNKTKAFAMQYLDVLGTMTHDTLINYFTNMVSQWPSADYEILQQDDFSFDGYPTSSGILQNQAVDDFIFGYTREMSQMVTRQINKDIEAIGIASREGTGRKYPNFKDTIANNQKFLRKQLDMSRESEERRLRYVENQVKEDLRPSINGGPKTQTAQLV